MATPSPVPRLITSLLEPAGYPQPTKHVQLLETHISWVLLAGRYAYKIKKPVDFGFLDFSDLAARRFYCEEEIRLNRRLAPNLYLGAVAIGGSPNQPLFGVKPAFEYAVKMRRFAADKLANGMLEQNRLHPEQIDQLAETIANFHVNLPSVTGETEYGHAETVMAPVRENFQQLASMLTGRDAEKLKTLQTGSEHEFAHCAPMLEQRRRQGMIRECHGDLHLGNIVMLRGRLTPFDGIEFNPKLRWIDVISDVAFLTMDILHRNRADLAYRFLNAYLQETGDYASLTVLHFYLSYRAMVRAKVSALRAIQSETADFSECRSYLLLNEKLSNTRMPALIITHGLPGCGKTTVSQIVLEKIGAIRIRSDVERKRFFGLKARQSSNAVEGLGIYTQDVTEHTYRHLLELARQILHSGYPVIVDAAFLQQQERRQFGELAQALSVPFIILSIHSKDEIQRQRIQHRQTTRRDASEADVVIYERLKIAAEALTDEEREFTLTVSNNHALDQVGADPALWTKLAQLLGRNRYVAETL